MHVFANSSDIGDEDESANQNGFTMIRNEVIETEKIEVVMKKKIKDSLSIFDKVGVASADRFDDLEYERHPRKRMDDFKSIIVFAKADPKSDANSMGGFSDYLGTLSAQSEAIEYLESMGYKCLVVVGEHRDISLVRMGSEAGVGEISPVNSLLVKGFGLTAALGAIITDAPLEADEKVSDICINCDKCLNVCPIREIANARGDISKCACGKCVPVCPM